MKRAAYGLALLCLASAALAQEASPRPFPALPLWITVAEASGATVVTDAWIDAQIENANTLFAPHGVTFQVADRGRMGDAHVRLETRRDRHRLGALMHRRAIDWFVVESLRDVDEPSRYRQGVHWRPRGSYPEGAHFVITSSIAGEHVLAHELGHYFGNPHSDVPGNIMSYERGDRPPFFDADQSRRIRTFASRFLASGELVAASELSSPRAR